MVRIITDSTSDVTKEFANEWNVDVLPLTVYFGEEVYRDGVNLTRAEFYDKLEHSGKLPKTSQLTPLDFTELFEKYLAQGDEIVCISLAAELSGTFQSSTIAKEMVGSDKIHVIDSRTATFGLALIVNEMVKMRDTGLSAKELYDKTMVLTQKIRVMAMLKTLKYLKLGGRISATSAVVGTLLGINPIISLVDGKVENIGKARGVENAYAFMVEQLKTADLDENYPVSLGHANSPADLQKFSENLNKNNPLPVSFSTDIGSTVGTYTGPGAVGIGYFVK